MGKLNLMVFLQDYFVSVFCDIIQFPEQGSVDFSDRFGVAAILHGLNVATVSYICKFSTVSTCYMEAFVWFFGIGLIFCSAEWAFLPSLTNTVVSSFLSFGFMRLKTILPKKHTVAIGTIHGRFGPGGKVWTGFILMVTGRAILTFAVMVTCIFNIIASITMAAIIGSVHQGGNTSKTIIVPIILDEINHMGCFIIGGVFKHN